MDRTLFTTLILFAFTLLLAYLLFSVLSPFLAPLVWATAIGVITRPLYERLLNRCKGRKTAAAALMTLAIVLAVVLPLVGLIFALSPEAALAYQYLERANGGAPGAALAGILRHPAVAPWLERLRPLTRSLDLELDAIMVPAVKQGIGYLLNYSAGIVKDFVGFLIKLGLMVITLFFIYRDGTGFLRRFWKVVAIRESLRTAIVDTVVRVLGAVMYGIILTCLVQGALGGLGFWVAGLPAPILFGALMAVCALIPLVGTALIWVPGSLYLLIQGETLKGVLLLAWGVLAVSGIDNVIRPLFISGRAKLPLLVIVLGVLGGFVAFGFTGVVAGPVVLALCLVLFEAYREETAVSE
ncbi:MAG TPA: AI-2E family transporter [Geobacteraceae bacterium]